MNRGMSLHTDIQVTRVLINSRRSLADSRVTDILKLGVSGSMLEDRETMTFQCSESWAIRSKTTPSIDWADKAQDSRRDKREAHLERQAWWCKVDTSPSQKGRPSSNMDNALWHSIYKWSFVPSLFSHCGTILVTSTFIRAKPRSTTGIDALNNHASSIRG